MSDVAKANPTPPLSYGDFARMLYGTGIISDPWLGGKERFQLRPASLSESQAEQLRTAAERVGLIYHELSEIVIRHPELLDQFFNLTPWQKAMWLASEGRWHGIARVDLFICADGHVRACEMNSDTPSGANRPGRRTGERRHRLSDRSPGRFEHDRDLQTVARRARLQGDARLAFQP